jgi:predicted Zn-dependent peptidase
MALEAPGYRSGEYHAAQIASIALGGGMASRLFQEAREKRGLCYTIFAQTAAWSETGMMTVYAGTGANEIGGLIDLTADELARAARDLTDAEIARARTQTKAGLVMGLESPASRAERMAAMLSIWGEVPPIEESIAKIDAVTVERARSALASMLRSSPSLALYGPVASARPISDMAARLAA